MPKESLADERARLAMETKTLGENLKGTPAGKKSAPAKQQSRGWGKARGGKACKTY